MAFVQCPNGHIYDNSKYKECPFCAQAESLSPPPEFHAPEQEMPVAEADFPELEKTPVEEQTPLEQEQTAVTPDLAEEKTIALEVEKISEEERGEREPRRLVGFLVTFSLNKLGDFFPLYLGKNNIGRSSQNEIVLNDSSVSGSHAMILFRGNQIIIEDKLSVNGTFVNQGSESIDRENLKDGDIIRLGKVVCKLMVVGNIPEYEG